MPLPSQSFFNSGTIPLPKAQSRGAVQATACKSASHEVHTTPGRKCVHMDMWIANQNGTDKIQIVLTSLDYNRYQMCGWSAEAKTSSGATRALFQALGLELNFNDPHKG